MNSAGPIARDGEKETTLLDLAIVIAKRKKLVLGVPFIGGILALVVALLLPEVYTATARILPPQQKESTATAMLGMLAGATGPSTSVVGQALGIRNPNDLYAAILKGRSIADALITQFQLKELYEVETMVDARKALEIVTRVAAGKDGLITIDVDDHNPKRAADIANAYVERLDELMQGLALTEASQRRLFFEKQLTTVRDQLITAEATLRRAIDTKGIAGVDAQSRAIVGTVEQLRAQIAAKEIQLESIRSFATNQNPDAVRLRHELTSMKAELGNLERGRPASAAANSPSGLESLRKLREVKFLEFQVELLTKQYEIAKIDEAKDAVLIQIVDKAIPPDRKSKPQRALIVIVTTILLGLVALIAAFVVESLDRSRGSEERQHRLETLKHYLRSL